MKNKQGSRPSQEFLRGVVWEHYRMIANMYFPEVKNLRKIDRQDLSRCYADGMLKLLEAEPKDVDRIADEAVAGLKKLGDKLIAKYKRRAMVSR